jgi:hypothetical protein
MCEYCLLLSLVSRSVVVNMIVRSYQFNVQNSHCIQYNTNISVFIYFNDCITPLYDNVISKLNHLFMNI